MSLREWVQIGRKMHASDLHVEGGSSLAARVGGDLRPVGGTVATSLVLQVGKDILGTDAWNQFMERGSADVSLVLGGTRCRINLYRTIRGLAIAIRLLAPSVHDLRTCNLHPDLRKMVEPNTGLVVISGPTGCGKSTTLAALIEEMNADRARHIITLESPLEYLYTNRRSFIRQREIPTHSPNFEQAIIDALRENPDVLVISEMRTPEVIRLTLNAAETGHLVLATMHSSTCAESLSRICMAFPADIQGNIRAQLADCLVGVVCQRLEFLQAHQLRVPRCEILLASSGAKGAIRSGHFSQIANVMQAGGDDGMWTFDRYQRWMDRQSDWTRPPPPGAVPDDLGAPKTALRPEPKPLPRPVTPVLAADAGPIEISIEENADLTELAKRIERRTW
ncbi:MAG: Flp pilus assembly complex ATPase component TadA [Pseudomonadota bacterium]|nr:Flp pilus assembly complex ATPase component TadA [Pseudomonadota bacterium]